MVAIIEVETETIFDYEFFDSESRIVIKQRTSEIKGLIRTTGQQIIEIGRKLIEVNGLLSITPGDPSISKDRGFQAWLKAEFGMSKASAYRFINVAKMADSLSVGQSSKLESLEATALYELAASPKEIQEQALEAAENVTITKSLVQEFKRSRQELIGELKAAQIGDYCRMSDGAIAKIIYAQELSITAIDVLNQQKQTYHLENESMCFQEVITLSDWVILEDQEGSGQLLNYRGWDIAALKPGLDFIGGYACNQEIVWVYDSSYLKIPQLTTDKDWHILQAKKFVDFQEENSPRPDIPRDQWKSDKSPLGNFYCQLHGNYDLRLIKTEGTEDVAGACVTNQTSSGEVYIFWDDCEPSLISAFPQLSRDRDWWKDQAQLFVDQVDDEESRYQIGDEVYYNGIRAAVVSFAQPDRDGASRYLVKFQEKGKEVQANVGQNDLKPIKKKLPSGHLHAVPKNFGQNTPNHPSYDNWEVGDIAIWNDKSYRVKEKNSISLSLVDSEGFEDEASYSEITKWAGRQAVPLAYANRDCKNDGVLPWAVITRNPQKNLVVTVVAEDEEIDLCHCKTSRKALEIAEYFNAVINGQVEIPKGWRKQVK